MSVTAIVGGNWGDEGKGKMTDLLAKEADYVVRFQGGNNAGHTIINSFGKFQLHLLPSGVFYKKCINVLGTGVALNIEAFLDEFNDLLDRGVPKPKIIISDKIQLVLPHHILLDKYEEEKLGEEKFGSTESGIAPFYADKYYKIGIRISDLFEEKTLLKKIKTNIAKKNILLERYYNKPLLIAEEIYDYLYDLRMKIAPFITDTSKELNFALENNKTILMEAQLGALKDPDHGIYPFTTSSSTLSGFASVGAGIPACRIEKVVTVVKAYSTCVGAGTFVSEIFDSEADELRELGGDCGEYGATTGRARRVGWFDVVATKYGCMIQGTNEVALTLLDVLGYLEEIPVCVAYSVDGQIINDFPGSCILNKATPVIKKLKGWNRNISAVRKYDDLPIEAKEYVSFIESQLGYPVKYISVGPDRDAIIYK
ncbi:MAG: adenylosuccinate synthase [Candidatus Delongbacteria bacterium]|jgi:adenylosuccinate synthase|nr:adenylosuccinate synthase [Candidatus Delongbacteria bacterium]